ncbi:efflux RND transporter periplasmic adaptor subunit [Stenotrophomonas rhizophila]|uniref:efflux RND transporter periplasmic adaptor subunit n=1 Tax=Stenotrophomonas rhizophila TaxID=216778 RepID=UPI00349197FD
MGVMKVGKTAVTLTTELPGRTVPYLIADVRPQVGGIVKKRAFTEGADVKAGETLYEIESDSYQAAYETDVASLARAQATLRTARLKAERYKELVSAKAVSQQDYDDAASTYDEASAAVKQAEATVRSSRINLNYARVTAPISGRIGKSTVTPGALVTASQANALTTIQQLDPIYVDVTQPSAAMLRLKQALASGDLAKDGASAAKAQLLLEDGSKYPLEGKLEFSDVTVDQETGSVTLRAVFANPNGDLLPGMYVRAVLQEGVNQEAILVPQRAVSRDNAGRPTAYIVNAQGKLELRALETERAIGDQWLVRSGLKPGDQLVVDGQSRAAAGAEVKTTPWQPAAAPSPAAE